MKKIVSLMTLTYILGSTQCIALVDIEKEILEPVAEMKMLDDAMNRGIEEQRQRNESFVLPMEDEKEFHEAEMPEFILKGKLYILEKRVKDVNNTKVSTEIKDGMLTITTIKKAEAVTMRKEEKLGTSTETKYFESTTSESLSLPHDADEDSVDSNYKDGLLRVIFNKK